MSTQVVELLGGERVLGKTIKTNLDLARATREGLPPESAIQLASWLLNSSELRSAVDAAQALVIDESHLADLLRLEQPWQMAIDPVMGPMAPVRAEALRAIAEAARTHTSPRRLTPEESDLVFRTASVMARAIEVLGDKEKAVHWLTSPNRALGGEYPINLLDTSAGTRELETILDRIEYGVYS